MSVYFAELDPDNLVLQVIVATPEHIKTLPGKWIKTCIHGSINGRYAGPGMQYDEETKKFKDASYELISEIKQYKDENGKQVYLKKFNNADDKRTLRKIPLKRKTYFLICGVTGNKIKSKRPEEYLEE